MRNILYSEERGRERPVQSEERVVKIDIETWHTLNVGKGFDGYQHIFFNITCGLNRAF